MVRPFSRAQHVLGSVALTCALVASSAVPAVAAPTDTAGVIPFASSAAPSSAAVRGTLDTDVPAVPPVVVGNPVVGELLSLDGIQPEGAQVQWLRDGLPLSGATGADYRLVLEDACSVITAQVTPAEGSESFVSNGLGPIEVPVSQLTAPVVQGTYGVGQTLTAVPGTMPSRASVHYQWLRNGVDIAGATQKTYVLSAADVGQTVTVRVTGSLDACGIPAVTSAGGFSAVVAAGVFSAPEVKITGTGRVGIALTAVPGTWPSGSSVSYQWLRNGAVIKGATASSYTLVAADLNTRISARVTGTKPGYTTVVKTSPQTAAITAGNLSAATPKLTGTGRVGSALSAVPGSWTPGTALSYQWLRNGAVIKGATASKYTLSSADLGKKISVRITGTKAGYTTQAKISPQTSAIAAGILSAPAAKLTGTARVGSALTAVAGTWTSGTAVSYQWLRNGAVIKGATASKYALSAADRGTKISVRITGAKAGYTTKTATSARTSAIAAGILTAPTPKITGTARVGSTLSVNRGTWTSRTALSQQWLRNGAVIKGATGASYRLTSADLGRTITVRVIGSKAGYSSATRTSSGVRVSTVAPPASGGSCPAAYPIKGNADSGIYHVPSGQYYSRTKAEECFATPAAAAAAGYRASKR